MKTTQADGFSKVNIRAEVHIYTQVYHYMKYVVNKHGFVDVKQP